MTLEAYGCLYRSCFVEFSCLVGTDTSIEHMIDAARVIRPQFGKKVEVFYLLDFRLSGHVVVWGRAAHHFLDWEKRVVAACEQDAELRPYLVEAETVPGYK